MYPVQSNLLLCISPDNHMLHVGPALDVMAHVLVDVAPIESIPPTPLEVYDITGRRLTFKEIGDLAGAVAGEPAPLERQGRSIIFAPPAKDGCVTEATLLRRIGESLDFAQSYLTAHPEAGDQGPNVPPVTEVPRPQGSYAEVLEGLAGELFPLNPNTQTHSANWFHNLWHAATGTH